MISMTVAKRTDFRLAFTFVVVASAVGASREVRGEVPGPEALRAKLIVHGRTSTAVDIPIRKTGQEIPRTYAGEKVARTAGFEFYVSEHFALKTNLPEERARHILEISELGHPHWVALIGADVPDPQTRMLITYADNVESLRQAMSATWAWGLPEAGSAAGSPRTRIVRPTTIRAARCSTTSAHWCCTKTCTCSR